MTRSTIFNYDISASAGKTRRRTRSNSPEEPAGRTCAWDGCNKPGVHPAPRSREQLREFSWFCVDHIREYNRSWNYFEGLDDEVVESFTRANATWQRPTWRMGQRSANDTSKTDPWAQFADAYAVFDDGPAAARARKREAPARPRLPPATEEAMAVLDLEPPVTLHAVKQRYKELVKRFHPDANNGDRSMEDHLKKVIWAYNHLKASPYVTGR